jgi:hypothetical protein
MSRTYRGDVATSIVCDICEQPGDPEGYQPSELNAGLIAAWTKHIPHEVEHVCNRCLEEGHPCLLCGRWTSDCDWDVVHKCCSGCAEE